MSVEKGQVYRRGDHAFQVTTVHKSGEATIMWARSGYKMKVPIQMIEYGDWEVDDAGRSEQDEG